MLEGARRLETLCLSVQDTLNAPVVQVRVDGQDGFIELMTDVENFSLRRLRLCLQPLSPSSRHRLKQLTDKHGSGQIHQVTGTVVAIRDLDLNLAKGELVAVISEADTRGDRRRWLVDAGGETSLSCALNRNRHRVAVFLGCRQKRLRSVFKADSLSPASRGAAPLTTPDPTWRADGGQKTLLHPGGRVPGTPGSALLPGDESTAHGPQPLWICR